MSSPRSLKVTALPRVFPCAVGVILSILAPVATSACPSEWIPAPGLVTTNGQVFSIATLPDGQMILGGDFTTAGGMPANRVVRFNPANNSWSTLGSGITGTTQQGSVFAVAAIPGGDVIVGGSFGVGNGGPANFIARYNAATNLWTPLGLGVNAGVSALAVLPGGDVIVGGAFSIAGGVPAINIARYNPTNGAWSALGTGVSSAVLALLPLPGAAGGDVLVGGQFQMAGAVTVNRVARYTSSTNSWSALGSGVTVSSGGTINVNALGLLPGGDFLIGGDFAGAGTVPALNLARYDPVGNAWSALGSGANGSVRSLAVLPGGDAIVGGGFSTIGGLNSRGVGRYNPTSGMWSKLGSSGLNGPSEVARALALTASGDLIIGGNTTGGGNVPLNGSGFARYTFPSACIADFNCSGGQPTVQDVFDFLAAWFSNDSAANVNGAAGISVQDIFDFLEAWFTGCP